MLTFEEKEKFRNAIRKGYAECLERPNRHTFCGAFIRKHPNRVFALEVLRSELGHIPTWDDLTDLTLMDFREAMQKKYVANSCRVYFAELRALVHEYEGSFPIPSQRIDKILTSKREPSQAVWLTSDELRRFHNYSPQTPTERVVKRIFMTECLTGARHEDAAALRVTNCDIVTNNISYVSQKTKHNVTLPVHNWLRQYLAEWDSDNTPEPTLSTQNEIIRNICRAVRIDESVTIFRRGESQTAPKYEFVSTHTGRRSFATNLFTLGVDPYAISRYMGHSSPDITVKTYIIGYREDDENAVKFFNQM